MDDGPITEQGDPRDRITNQLPLQPSRAAGPSPIDTIREALEAERDGLGHMEIGPVLAALTEVEQHLAVASSDSEYWQERAVAAQTALAEATKRVEHLTDACIREADKVLAAEQRANDQQARADDLEIRMDAEIVEGAKTEQQRDDLADALRPLWNLAEAIQVMPSAIEWERLREPLWDAVQDAATTFARAALDRHTPTKGAP